MKRQAVSGQPPAASAALPEMLAVVAEAAGPDAAVALAEAFGGTQRYIPKNMTADHPIAAAIGIRAARALVARYGHGHVFVPLGPASGNAQKALVIRQMLAAGSTPTEIARALHVHVVTVKRARRRMASSAA